MRMMAATLNATRVLTVNPRCDEDDDSEPQCDEIIGGESPIR